MEHLQTAHRTLEINEQELIKTLGRYQQQWDLWGHGVTSEEIAKTSASLWK